MDGKPGNLASMVQGMAQTSQPRFLSSLVNAFGTFAAGHGFAVNLVLVVALAATGLALASGRRAVLRPAIGLLLVLCAAVWVLVQDLGVFGGLGTDPNSMIPFALVAVGGYLALAEDRPGRGAARPDRRRRARPARRAGRPPGDTPSGPQRGWRDRLRPQRLAALISNASPRTLGLPGPSAWPSSASSRWRRRRPARVPRRSSPRRSTGRARRWTSRLPRSR